MEKVQTKVKGLILENTFTKIGDMVDSIFPYLRAVKGLIQRIYWPSIDRIRNIKVPILFISGQRDEIVPKEQMQALYDAAESAPFKEIYRV